ncbi:MAG TPA: cytochrome c [Verrucomicrobiae bacterium]|nr:cytochrome c [Verrucomicrobiae bacterium]
MADDLRPPPEAHDIDPTLPGVDYSERVSVTGIHAAVLREKIEPREGMEPMPIWLWLAVSLLIGWGGWYLGTFSGGYRADNFDERIGSAIAGGAVAGTAAGGTAAKEDPAAAFAKLGKRQFTANCQSCHQATGLGQAGVYPPLAGSEYVLGNKKRVIAIVLKGLQGPFKVKGNTYNNVMQSWEPVLDDKKIAAILTYVRNEWGNKAEPITPEEVAAVRAEFASRKVAWTEADLLAIPENATINVAPATNATPPAAAPSAPTPAAPAPPVPAPKAPSPAAIAPQAPADRPYT